MTAAHPRLSLNQATIKHTNLADALAITAAAGISAIGLWREPVAEVGLAAATRMVTDSGLRVSSLCRAGFFTQDDDAARRRALDDNRRAIEETAILAQAGAPGSAPVLVLVAGGLPEHSTDLVGARTRVGDALAELEPEARRAGVRLALEPLHPMYVADRAVVSTLAQALELVSPFPAESVGVIVDTFHIWWDPAVLHDIARAGAAGRIASYQVSDFLTPLPSDVLLSRAMMGDGHIDFGPMTHAINATGYRGDVEVEIFNADVWATPPQDVVHDVIRTFTEHIPLTMLSEGAA